VLPPRVVFVTQGKLQGDMGFAGADNLCNAEGRARRQQARFVAFLQNGTMSPEARLMGDNGPWHHMTLMPLGAGGTRAFADRAALAGPPETPFPPLPVAEYAWIGGSLTCGNWTTKASNGFGFIGEPGVSTGRTWRDFGMKPCDQNYRLVCFEVRP
jgi:hypothetical protein